MYCIISKRPIEEFFESEDQKQYIDTLNYFYLKSDLKKSNIGDCLYSSLESYNIFENEPIYVRIMTDNYYFRRIQDSLKNTAIMSKLPYREALQSFDSNRMLPINKRLWSDENYTEHIINMFEKFNYKKSDYLEIFVNGH